MKTKRLEVTSESYEQSISAAAEILNDGGIVAIPTETVYGLAGSAYCDAAITKIFEAKGRPQDNPLIVHIAELSQLYCVAKNVSETAKKCADAFWPGPFTMVLPKGEKVAKSVSAGLETVAIRMPDNKVARDIIKSSVPLAAPSANLSGRPSPTTANHVIDDLDGKIDAVMMGNDCAIGVESTVISLCGEKPRLLRPGAITLEQLRELLPDIEVDDAVLNELKTGQQAASPGMKYKHYAPKTETILVEGEAKAFARFVNGQQNCCAICFSEEAELITVKKLVYGSQKDSEKLAHNLFSALRKVDDMGAQKVYIHAPEKSGVGLAVYNRLIRAAAFKVISL